MPVSPQLGLGVVRWLSRVLTRCTLWHLHALHRGTQELLFNFFRSSRCKIKLVDLRLRYTRYGMEVNEHTYHMNVLQNSNTTT